MKDSKADQYPRHYYRELFGEDQADAFFDALAVLDAFVANQRWELTRHYNQRWCAFIAQSNRAAFGMAARANGELYLYIKRVRDEAAASGMPHDYNDRWDQAAFPYTPGMHASLERFLPLFKVAVERSAFGA